MTIEDERKRQGIGSGENGGNQRPTGAGTSHSPYYTARRDVPRAGILWGSIVGAVACPCPGRLFPTSPPSTLATLSLPVHPLIYSPCQKPSGYLQAFSVILNMARTALCLYYLFLSSSLVSQFIDRAISLTCRVTGYFVSSVCRKGNFYAVPSVSSTTIGRQILRNRSQKFWV